MLITERLIPIRTSPICSAIKRRIQPSTRLGLFVAMPRRIDMKKLLPYILGFAVSFLGASAATIVPSYLTPKYEQHPSSYIAPVTGSSSPVAAIVTHVIDTTYVVQGSCEKVKDLD